MSLYLLSPVIAELVLGASPPLNFVLFSWSLIPMYGGGAILIRELALRWGKGWPTIIALGVAYAIAEEGIAVRTFFDPTAPALSGLKDYGWIFGANWVWIVGLCLYHAFVSIGLPIMLVSMHFPDRAKEPWVSDRWLRLAAFGFVAIVTFWLLAYQRPVDGRYVMAALAVIAWIALIAYRLPEDVSIGPGKGGVPSPRTVAIVVASSVIGIFLMSITRGLGQPPPLAAAEMLAIAALCSFRLARWAARPGWSDRHRFAMATGVFAWMILFSPLVELSGGLGQVVVALVTAWLTRRTWRRLAAQEAAREVDTARLTPLGPIAKVDGPPLKWSGTPPSGPTPD
jgi:hypothetical protein